MQIVPLADRREFVWELAALHHAEWKHLNPSLTLQKRAAALMEAAGREGIPSIFIATSETQLIGSAAVVKQDMDTRPDLSPWLASVFVKKDFRHQGIATALIARCECEAAKSGANSWHLFTEYAAKLYEHLGWRHMERCEYRGVMVNVMSKPIVS